MKFAMIWKNDKKIKAPIIKESKTHYWIDGGNDDIRKKRKQNTETAREKEDAKA